jgi:hypothetical protein
VAELSTPMQAILDFVSGAMRPESFAQAFYADPGFEPLLDDGAELPRPSYITGAGCPNTYHFLLTRDFGGVGDVLNAQGALTQFLDRRGIPYVKTDEYENMHGLLLGAQPTWLDVDTKFLQTHVLPEAPADLKKAALKKWLRDRLKVLFKFASKPPRWVQSPQWPIRDDRPLVFLGQFAIKDYFHDEAAVYVFHDPVSGECQTIIQVY